MGALASLVAAWLLLLLLPTQAFTGRPRTLSRKYAANLSFSQSSRIKLQSPVCFIRGGGGGSLTVREMAINPALLSVVAGSLAGAIGVGIAFPLDTLKTKAQVLRSSSSAGSSVAAVEKLNMFQLMALVWDREGLAGFFGGVKGMMVGQAVIKALAFSVNANTITYLQHQTWSQQWPSVVILLVASSCAGFITSFVVSPIERIKINMQADSTRYKNEFDCLTSIVKSEGLSGLLTRGLGTTLTREVPSYGLYFWLYGVWSQSGWIQHLLPPAVVPLVVGALCGMASWLPVYPIDVVKTTLQNGSQQQTAWDITRQLYREGGIGAFFDGLDAKLMRAAVNHAVTFFVFENIMQTFGA